MISRARIYASYFKKLLQQNEAKSEKSHHSIELYYECTYIIIILINENDRKCAEIDVLELKTLCEIDVWRLNPLL